MQRSVCVLRWVVLFALLGLVLVATSASANVPVFLNMWGSEGTGGNGKFYATLGIAVGPDGDLFVTDDGNYLVQRFSADGAFEMQWGEPGTGPGQFTLLRGVAVADSGTVYVADGANHVIQAFDTNGIYLQSWGSVGSGNGEFNYPFDLRTNTSGQIYVTDVGNNRVQRFSASGVYEDQWGSFGSATGQFSEPRGVVVTGSGVVYVVDKGNYRIQRFSAEGDYELQWGSYGTGAGEFDFPLGIEVSRNGLVYVTDIGNSRIQRFDSDGNYQMTWGSPGSIAGQFQSPVDMAVTGTGLVYVLDRGNARVQRFLDYAAWVDPATHTLPDSIEFDTDFILNAGKSLSVPGTTTVYSSWLRVEGGSLYANDINLIGGVLYYRSGSLDFTNLNAGMLFVGSGSPLQVPTGMTAHPDDLVVDVDATLIMAGGEVMTNGSVAIGSGGNVLVSSGRFGTTGGYFYNSGELLLSDAVLARVSSPIIDNPGVIRGSGRIEGVLLNTGEVRVAAGEHLRIALTGAGHENSGRIEAIGNPQYGGPAELEFADHLLNHGGTGLIAARNAKLRFSGTLTNQGSLAFSFGTSDVFGDITNTGNISVLGGAEVTFYDDVDGVGGTFIISQLGNTTSKVVILGGFNAGFTGGGELYAYGDLRPGSSPAAVMMGGDLFLGDSTNTLIEIGGLAAGTLFDTIDVTGDVALDGNLSVSLIDPLGGGDIFVPRAGDSFEILTAGELLGTFDAVTFPAIPGKPGLEWLIDYDTTLDRVLLSVAPIFGADFDEDGDVDRYDLAQWQAGYSSGTLHTQGDADGDGDVDGRDFLAWQRQFGSGALATAIGQATRRIADPGSTALANTLGVSANIPEPVALSLAVLAGITLALRWPNAIQQKPNRGVVAQANPIPPDHSKEYLMIDHMNKSNLLLILGVISLCLVFIEARAFAVPLGVADVLVNESIGGVHTDHHEDPTIASAALSYTLGSGWSEVSLPRGTLKTYFQTSTSDVVETTGAQGHAYASLDDYFTVHGLAPGTSEWITGQLHVTGRLVTAPGQSTNWYSGVLVYFGGPWGRELFPTEGGEVNIDTVLAQTYQVYADEPFRVRAELSSYGWGWNHNDILSDFSETASLTFDLPMGTSITSEGGYAPGPLADFNEDGDVDGDDLTRWQAGYSIGTLHTEGDADLDGDVDGRDFLQWQRQYGSHSELVANVSVPEPTGLLCILIFGIAGSVPRFHVTWRGAEMLL